MLFKDLGFSFGDKIVNEIVSGQPVVLIYGEQGCGKTTMMSQIPDCLFFTLEGKTGCNKSNYVQVDSYNELLNDMRELYIKLKDVKEKPIKAIVIDTLTKLNTFIVKQVLIEAKEADKRSDMPKDINDSSFPSLTFGKGISRQKSAFINFMDACKKIAELGIRVHITAHTVNKVSKADSLGGGGVMRADVDINDNIFNIIANDTDIICMLDIKEQTQTIAQGVQKVIRAERILRIENEGCRYRKSSFYDENVLKTIDPKAYPLGTMDTMYKKFDELLIERIRLIK